MPAHHGGWLPRRETRPFLGGKCKLRLLTTSALLLPAIILAAACGPKIARVPVSTENIIRANELARDGDSAFARKDFYSALIRYLEASRLNANSEYIQNKLGITYSQL